jgi:hypothetical protein
MDDLLAFVRADLGPEVKTSGRWHYWRCPFHDETDASFGVTDDGRGWHCFGCNRSGDLIAYRVERGDLTPREAGRLRHAGENGAQRTDRAPQRAKRRTEPQKPTLRPSQSVEGPSWDPDAALKALEACEAALWADEGAKAKAWLGVRGLSGETLRLWRLGYNAEERELHGVWTPRGIVIPGLTDGELRYLKVRRPVPPLDGPKYQCAKGSRPGLFGLDHLAGKRTAVICEGEFDAMLLHQEAGDLVEVVAIGGKTATPTVQDLARLASASRWLLALDRDAEERVDVWAEYSERVRRIRPLEGNDITDFYKAGGDLRLWIHYYLAGEANLEAEAEKLLEAGLRDPNDRQRYAEIAQVLGWRWYEHSEAPWELEEARL